MKATVKKKGRSSKKIPNRIGDTLRFMRQSNSLSVRAAGALVDKSDSWVSHVENGRMEPPKNGELNRLVLAYGFSTEEFEAYVTGLIPLPVDCRAECRRILEDLEAAALQKAFIFLAKLKATQK